MHIANASEIELAWAIANLLVLAITGYLFREAVRDYNAVIRSGENGLTRRVAIGGVRRFALKFIMAVSFVAAGIVAALFVPPTPNRETAGLTAIFFIVADLSLVILSLESAAERFFAMEYLRREARIAGVETQNQREDREFGEQRRALEEEHSEAEGDAQIDAAR